jgi:glycosyltransferase involved in cell wall biosynthesis
MRVGQNPNRYALTDYRPKRVTVCVLTHVPDQSGYYARRFDVLRLCLASLIANTAPGSYDLLIFDNGSCGDVVRHLTSLRDSGRARHLILSSANIGIYNALKVMFNAAQGEILAYSQDDVFFYPGWLDAQLRILETFPDVGLVSGIPVRHQFRYGNSYLPGYLARYPDVAVTRGKLIPEEWEADFHASIGVHVKEGADMTRELEDVLLEYRGVPAFSTAVHFQYVARRETMLRVLDRREDQRLMVGPDGEIDLALDRLGLARLSTAGRYVRHVGNVVTEDLAPEFSALGLAIDVTPPSRLAVAIRMRVMAGLRRVRNWYYFARKYRPLR